MSKSHGKTFYSYVVPSVLAFALSGVYTIVDGFFVGRSVGDIGLSTINIAYPVVSLLQALGTGIGMGGAVLYTLNLSSGKQGEAKKYLRCTTVLLLAVSALLTVLLFFTMTPVLRLLGATGEMVTLGEEYLEYIVTGTVFQIFATGVVPIIRNNSGAKFAMGTMIAGFLCNIALDYLFVWVFEWSVAGAALATIIGQALTALGGFVYLAHHKIPVWGIETKGTGKGIKDIFKIGIAPFGISLTPLISHLFMNRFSVQYGGEVAVASYACIGYVFAIVCLLVQGVGDGSQPLVSQYYGQRKMKAVLQTRKLAYRTAAVLAALCIAGLYAARGLIGPLFGASAAATESVASAMPVFLSGYLFLAFSRVTTAVFYATEKVGYSYMLVYIEPVFQVLLLLILPRFWDQTGVWWSMPLAQILTAATAAVLKVRTDTGLSTGFAKP